MVQRASTLTKSRKISNLNPKESRCLARLGLALGLAVSVSFGIIPHGWAQQTGEFEWLVQFGVATNDFSWDVHADENGNVYVAGDTSGELPGQRFAGGALDAFVRKYDANGNELWTRQYGTTGNDRNAAVFPYGADLYVGWLTTGAFPGQVNLGVGADAYLRKYDTNGHAQWTRQFGTPGADEVIGIFVHATGVYASGIVDGTLPGQTRAGGVDVFVRKCDFNGNELWTRQFGTTGRDVAFRISGDDSGVYIVGGSAGALPGQTHAGGSAPDAFVRKYDHDGSELWTRQFGTPAIDLAIGVSANATGLYVVGRADQALVGQSHAGGADAFVRRYDADGNELWTRQFGTTLFDLARGVSVRDSVVYVSGIIGGAGPGFPGGQAGADVFVRAYTSNGKYLWKREFGSELADDNWAISAALSGLYVIGSATGTLPGLKSQGDIDAFAGRLRVAAASIDGLFEATEQTRAEQPGTADDELFAAARFVQEASEKLESGQVVSTLVMLESAVGKLKDAVQKGISFTAVADSVALVVGDMRDEVQVFIDASGAPESTKNDARIVLGEADYFIAQADTRAGAVPTDGIGALDSWKAAVDKLRSAYQKVQ